MVEAGLRQQIAPVKEQPRVDVPGDTEHGAVHAIRVPDAGKVIERLYYRGGGDVRIERLERIQSREFRNPRVAEIADIG